MASQNLQTENMCAVDEKVAPVLKNFKKSKKGDKPSAIILKININEELIVIEDELEDITTEELMEELPETQPRYIVYRFEHQTADNRLTKPYCFIYYHPSGCKTDQVMRYAGCRNLVLSLSESCMSLELDQRENLTDDWLKREMKLP